MTIHSDRSAVATMQAEINVTPLIDVMLALVVVFMIATPLLMKRISLPLAGSNAPAAVNDPVRLAISANGALTWNDLALPPAMLREQLRVLARSDPQPELRIAVERTAAYQTFASVLADAKAADVAKISVQQETGD
ncbi:MAG: ExbD/TolR family protein [Rhodanobacteraceae bacterium]